MVFDEIAFCSVFQSLLYQVIVIKCGKDQNLPQILLHDIFGGLYPVHDRHLDIHQKNIGSLSFRQFDSILPVSRTPYNLKLIIHIQDDPHAVPHKIAVIRDYDFYLIHISLTSATAY